MQVWVYASKETNEKNCGLRERIHKKNRTHKESHRHEASEQCISQYIVEMNKTCKVCQSKAIQSKYKITCVTKTPR